MDSPVSPRSPRSPRRQLTLGPATPIQDWEVERATLLKNYKESHEKADRLEKLLQEEQVTFEKNTSSLLREVKLKETHLEKKLKDVEQALMRQILSLEQRLQDEKTGYQDQIKSLKATHEQTLEIEDKKYQRRLLGLQERLQTKDRDYTELLEKNNTDEEKDVLIDSLRLKLAEAEKRSERKSKEVEDLGVGIQEKLSETANYKHIDRINELERQMNVYKRRLDQASAGHNSQIQGLTEKFMSEAKQSEMVHQARIQNLQSEHDDMLRELREQHQIEKEVWSIEQNAAVDEVRRVLTMEKEEAVEKLNREWKDKYDDLHASMSKDSIEIQSHWEKKREENKNQYSAKVARLLGEIEVVKDRLGKEIERRKQNEHALYDCLEQNDALQDKLMAYQGHLKQHVGAEREIHQLRNTQRASSRLAKDVLSLISSDSVPSQSMDLQAMLQLILRNLSIIETRRDETSFQSDM